MRDDERLNRCAAELVARHMYPGADAGDVVTILSRGHRARLAAGTQLCREGDPGDTMFVVLHGRVQVLLHDTEGRSRQLAVVEPPALLGHVTLVDRSPRSATCVALDEVDAITLDGATYDAAVREPSASGSALRRLLIASLVTQLSSGNERIRAVIEGREDVASTAARRDPTPDSATAKPPPRPASSPPRKKPARRPPPRPAAVQPPAHKPGRGACTDDELLKIAGLLSGWELDTRGLDRMEVVRDEAAKRRQHRRQY